MNAELPIFDRLDVVMIFVQVVVTLILVTLAAFVSNLSDDQFKSVVGSLKYFSNRVARRVGE